MPHYGGPELQRVSSGRHASSSSLRVKRFAATGLGRATPIVLRFWPPRLTFFVKLILKTA